MSAIPVLMYTMGIGVFGFVYWLLDGILRIMRATGVHETGNTFDLLWYMWLGILVIYLIFGGIWVVRKYNEVEYRGGMM